MTSDTTAAGDDTASRDETTSGEATSADGGVASPGDNTDRGRPCPQCGAAMIHRHCEYVCPNHGVVMDCSDTFYN